jgi:hypothetical protein
VSLNKVILIGIVSDAGPKLSYSDKAKPECRLTPIVEEGKGEQTFRLFVPVFIYGPGAESAASEVDAGDIIAVDGKLSWKSTQKKESSKLGFVVSAWGVEIIVKAEPSTLAQAARSSSDAAPESPDHAPRRPEPKGKSRYAKWRPPARPVESAN